MGRVRCKGGIGGRCIEVSVHGEGVRVRMCAGGDAFAQVESAGCMQGFVQLMWGGHGWASLWLVCK